VQSAKYEAVGRPRSTDAAEHSDDRADLPRYGQNRPQSRTKDAAGDKGPANQIH
jgi:hypothetical protein